MEVTVFDLDIGIETLLDVDSDIAGNYLALTNELNVFSNYGHVKLPFAITFPIIRRLEDHRILVIAARTKGPENAHVFNLEGQLLYSFLVGDGVQDVLVHRNKIVVSYFDEGVMGMTGPNNSGVAVFDLDGKLLFGLNDTYKQPYVLDCYCMCKHGTNRVLLYTYTDFILYELNLDTFEVTGTDTPEAFVGASAISSNANQIFFHASYHHKTDFFCWNRTTDTVTMFSHYAPGLVGLPNGYFLSIGEKSFAIIDAKGMG